MSFRHGAPAIVKLVSHFASGSGNKARRIGWWGVLSARGLDRGAGRRPAVQAFAVDVDHAGSRMRGHELRNRRAHSVGLLGAFLRLIVPVVLLLTIGAASLAYADQRVAVPGNPAMNLGLAVLPLTFLAVHLTNRRYGAAYAVWQVVLAWIVGAAAVLGGGENSIAEVPTLTREALGFAAALFLAQLAAIVVFDRLRGPYWWQAPLLASLLGGLVLSFLAFPLAYAGTTDDWAGRMIDYVTWTSVMSLGLLLPYWLMRGLVPPKPGFGGY